MSDWIVIIEQEDGRLFAAVKQAETREDALAEVHEWCQSSRIVAVTKVPAFSTFAVLIPVNTEPVADQHGAWRGVSG